MNQFLPVAFDGEKNNTRRGNGGGVRPDVLSSPAAACGGHLPAEAGSERF